MTPTTVSQTNTIAKPTKVASAASEAPQTTEDFAALLEKSMRPTSGTTSKVASPLIAANNKPDSKVPKELAGLPLDFQGVEKGDEKNGKLASLSDLLATVSHESKAPEGTSILNLKNVLAFNNDDPELINSDLIGLLPAKDQKKALSALIKGAKDILQARLAGELPKDRIPKTLKGMIETAIRFSIAISDIKVESLPKSKVSAEILSAFAAKQEVARLSSSKSKNALSQSTMQTKLNAQNAATNEKAPSPLEQMLNPTTAAVTATTGAAVASQVLSKDVLRPDSKLDSKKENQRLDAKLDAKNDAKEESIKELSSLPPKEPLTASKVAQKAPSPLEQMLKEEQVEQSEVSSSEGKQVQQLRSEAVQKNDTALDLKIGEARQMMRQLSAEVKEAIDNYKPPFVKLSMRLNPAHLGEIDVSIIKRGDKVHVNLSSNQGVLSILQLQSNDLKVALTNAGLSDASMNFSHSGSSNKEQSQQNNQHSTAQKYQEMAALEDQLDTLELIIPQYG